MARKVEVINYTEDWKLNFLEEIKNLKGILGEEIIEIYHVGSTSIPGMPAKPIIDIIPVVENINRVDFFNEVFVRNGYIVMGEYGIYQRRFFIKGSMDERTHHIHVYEKGDCNIIRHILFRDYMIDNPQRAIEYALLKKKLSKDFVYDIEGYISGKNDFIKSVESDICKSALIRDAICEDAFSICKANIVTWKDAYKGIVSDGYLNSLKASEWEQRWEESIMQGNTKTKVVDLKGYTLGFVFFGIDKGSEIGASEIYAFYISPVYQSKGLGEKLFKEAYKELKNEGYNTLKIWTLRDNKYRKFYEKQGGVLAGEKTIKIGEQQLIEVLYRWNLN